MAISGIEAYQPETRADYINLARTISFSLAALSLLGQAASPDMPMPEKMRAFGRANALNRSADQSERTMMRRRGYLQSSPATESPDLIGPPDLPESQAALDDADMQAAINEAVAEYVTTCAQSRPAPQPPAPVAATNSGAHEPANVSSAPLARPASTIARTYSASSIKQSLLATSAMPAALPTTVPPSIAVPNDARATPTAPISQLMRAAAD
jgi:hypothetical protein